MHGIPIRSALDTAAARNVLRRLIAAPRYTPTFRARAAATLTALVEFVLSVPANGLLDLIAINRDDVKGIELRCSVMSADELQLLSDILAKQVSDVSDEIEFFRGSDRLLIVARVWTKDLEEKT